MTESIQTYCGYVAIIGRPNVGKSTLLNRILGQKLSITSHKPQTTRHQILGINTIGNKQIIYVDTPGLHKTAKHALNRYMNRTALNTLKIVDVIVFMVDGLRWTEEDAWILERLKKIKKPIILAVNKVDQIREKTDLLPHLQWLSDQMSFTDIVPIAAKKGTHVAVLEKEIAKLLPEGTMLFPADQMTDRSERFLASEIIREKLMRLLHQELPYALTVEIEEFKLINNILHINAIIWLEREGQKAIVIGEKGTQLKAIGTRARMDMEKIFGYKVFLRLWTKVKEGWSDDLRSLHSLGYNDF
jgi:GTP-binding protein Era